MHGTHPARPRAPAPSPGEERRVLVAHSYFLRYDPKQARRMKPYPPLGTLLAAAVARESGFDVAFFDAMLSAGVEEFETLLDEVRPRTVGILEDGFNFLTKMCTLRMRDACRDMIRMAKAHGCRVVVHGSDAGDHPGVYLEAGADAVIMGTAEHAFTELARLWARDPDAAPDAIAGLALPSRRAVLHDGRLASGDAGPRGTGVHLTRARPQLEDLDTLPLPAWDLVDAGRYREAWHRAHGRFSWNMAASRGCPYGCNWCAKPLFGRRYLQRGPGAVAAEMRRLRDAIAPDHIWFADDIFGLTAAWIRRFADEVRRLGARTPFMIQTRANLMTEPAVAALLEAGAEEVWLGVESGSQRILDAMDKGTRIEQIRTATRTLRDHGIRTGWFIQLGYLGEEWNDIVMTRELIRAERPDDIGVSVSYPLPGTAFHETVRAHLGTKRNWDHTGDLDMLFHGTYVADFYRRVRDLLHAEVGAGHAANGSLAAAWDELERHREEFRNDAVLHV